MHVDINSYVLGSKLPLFPCSRGYVGDGHQPNSRVSEGFPSLKVG